MKKIKIISFGFIALLFASCVNLLDQEPESEYSFETFYTKPAHAKAGVNGIYTQLQSVMRINFAYWGEGRADNVRIKHTGEPAYLHENQLTSTISTADWTSLYTLISNANYAIKYIPRVYDTESSEGNNLIGQARALRALAYFYLVRVWGDVPLILEPYTSANQDFFVSRTDKNLVLDEIEKDLIFATQNCVEKNGNAVSDRATITKGGAYGILTQVYMWRKKYSEAITAADQVIGNSLYTLPTSMPEWSKIFTTSYQSESVFEVGYNDTQTNQLRVLFAIGNDAIYTPSENLRNSFESGDLRQEYIYDVSLPLSSWGSMWKYLGKDVSDEDKSPSKQSIIIVRLADIIMLKAEALLATNADKNAALALLTPIRERAGLAPLDQATAVAKYGSVENAILHERRIELCFEGHRWFDLVRTGKAISTMGAITGISSEDNIVWPISQTSLDKNQNLTQNTYYGGK